MQLISASKPLDFIRVDIVGPFPDNIHSNQLLLVNKKCDFKLTRVVQTSKTTAMQVANHLTSRWLKPCGIPKFLHVSNWTQFVSSIFTAVRALFGVKLLQTSAYHLQTDCQAKQFNKTILTRLSYYVKSKTVNGDTFGTPLTYANNTKKLFLSKQTLFCLVLSRHSSRPSLLQKDIVLPANSYAKSSLQIVRSWLKPRIRTLWAKVDSDMALAPRS